MKINIRPKTSVYATYKNINYHPWNALAEFVDNSTQSYYDNIEKLENSKYWEFLEIEIIYDKEKRELIIRDNAHGMSFHNFQRAIVLDSKPNNKTRSEFGMGLKTAACWFGEVWSVETTELGSDKRYKATIDVPHLVKYQNEEIEVEETFVNPKEHYTIIKISKLYKDLAPIQIKKIKDQLSGIYREDLRTGKVKISYNESELTFNEPSVYIEKLPFGEKIWKKNFDFKINHNKKDYEVRGFVAIRDKGSTSNSGFSLFKRGRVIIGGYENTYRPEEIFGKPNSFPYQRVFGEIHVDDFPVTQTKDGFMWIDGLEDVFIFELKKKIKEYIEKASTIRKTVKVIIQSIVEESLNELETKGVISELKDTTQKIDKEKLTMEVDSQTGEMSLNDHEYKNESTFIFDNKKITFTFNVIEKSPEGKWLVIKRKSDTIYDVEWNISHPFFKSLMLDQSKIEVLNKFILSFALSEIFSELAKSLNKFEPSTIRNKLNDILLKIMGD
jgi:hypothetical protein